MSRRQRDLVSIAAGLVLIAALAYVGFTRPQPPVDLLAWLSFAGLFLFTDTFSVPIGGAFVSLAGATAVGAMLVVGPWAAAWIGLLGSLVNVGMRAALPGRFGLPRELESRPSLLAIGMFNAVLLVLSLLGSAAVYQAAGGPIPLRSLSLQFWWPYLLLLLTYVVINYSLAAVYLLPGDRSALRTYLRALPNAVFFETVPRAFIPLLPLIYTQLGAGAFLLFLLGVAGASTIVRGLAVTGNRLEQRLTELKTLSALGQALAASLQVDDLLATVREQVPAILPVGGLYVALWRSDTDEVSFPLAVEKGQPRTWETRQSVNGLSEYVMRTRQPLLIPDSVPARVAQLGLTPPVTAALGWLVVPMIAGSQVLGALGVYALDPAAPPLNSADRDLLVTIATQLAMALHNARLYGQTDEALSQRVQQLSSILYTTAEGILLLDAEARVLTANRALEGFVGLPAAELAGRLVATDADLLGRLGTTLADIQTDLDELKNGSDLVKRLYTTRQSPARDVERTLASVRGGAGDVTGWLMILRDVTEEQALGRLRDDLTYMLIHDLRGPLSSILTSLALIEQMAPPGQPLEPEAVEVLRLAHGSGRHLLHMINELLDIARLESGAVPLEREVISPEELLAGAVERLRPAADAASIRLEAEVAPGLPELSVDAKLIGRVLDNLGDNAVKFSPNNATIRLWTRPADAAGSVLFGVTDQGPGIAAQAQSQLFQKFNRLPNIHGRRVGTGLGLAFCRMVVEAHGGEIGLDSAPGQGSTFVVRLPALKLPSTNGTAEQLSAPAPT
jgi:PAS domain S-box-containing protein